MQPESTEDPWRLLAALAEHYGGELSLYAGDVDVQPADVRVEIRRETVVTQSRPEGYQVIVISVPGGGR